MEASNSPALKRISSNPSTAALNSTTANSNISTGMYYPHHYTGPTSTSSAYSSPYLSRSSRMHHNTISSGGDKLIQSYNRILENKFNPKYPNFHNTFNWFLQEVVVHIVVLIIRVDIDQITPAPVVLSLGHHLYNIHLW